MKNENRAWRKGLILAPFAYLVLTGPFREPEYIPENTNVITVYHDKYLVPANERGVKGSKLEN